jgi:hypothetical protein
MELSEDSLLKPLRAMSGLPAPGAEMGGWYLYDPDYDRHKGDEGFAPGCPSGNGFPRWPATMQSHAIPPLAKKSFA